MISPETRRSATEPILVVHIRQNERLVPGEAAMQLSGFRNDRAHDR
jgi:hypothetical protein